MAITSSAFAKALWPGIMDWWGVEYNRYPEQWREIFDVYQSNKQFEEDVGFSGFGLAPTKPEGQAISYDQARQGFLKRYTHTVYALGFLLTRENYDDNLYADLAKGYTSNLAVSMRQTKEVVCANVLNRAFNSSYTGADGLELCSTAHLNVAGGTWANELSTAADLSEASLEQAVIDIMNFKDDRDNRIAYQPTKLIIPRDLIFEAQRILKTPYRSGTSDNDLNALHSLGYVQDIAVNQYLTDADAWFIKTNCPNGMKYLERRPDEFNMVDNDFDTENHKYKSTMRFDVGWTDPRGIFGSPGA